MRMNWWTVAMVGAFALLNMRTAASAELEPLVVEAVIHAPIQEVWDSFYSEEGRAWMTPVNSIDLRIGGLIKSSYVPGADLDGDHAIHQEILAYELGRRMVAKQVRSPTSFPNREGLQGVVGTLEFDPLGPDATRVRSIMSGFPETPAGEAVYAFFKEGNAYTFDSAKAHLERPDQAQRTERALGLLGSLAGGEWIHESETPDGDRFRIRNVVRKGPDGASLLANGWLGFGDAPMFDHGPTLVWLDPDGVIRFTGVHETGAVSSGTISLVDDDTVEWDWIERSPSGERTHYLVSMTFPGGERYDATIEAVGDDGVRTPFAGPFEYRRVEAATERPTR